MYITRKITFLDVNVPIDAVLVRVKLDFASNVAFVVASVRPGGHEAQSVLPTPALDLPVEQF